ncbi:MAG: L-fucose:H+ symporter permease [Bacteroidia bacterium]|nr:L-fucose:H+ symporter permease [Bacteroidia bacterium]HQU99790.1 L-fucose:H+ symporter permease [Bacteroidia bacterium]
MIQKNTQLLPLVLIVSLFFLWGLAHNLNPILIPHLKSACNLSDFQSALIDSAFFIAYFIFAIPAGIYMSYYGYKNGIVLGLLLFAAGAFLFIPAANTLSYPIFLMALFVIAAGLTFLETAANPYVTILGNSSSAVMRLNLAQSFNGLGAFIAPLIGGMFILSDTHQSDAVQSTVIKVPYIIIGLVVFIVALTFIKIKLPEIADNTKPEPWQTALRHKKLLAGITAQFFYVGAQVGVSSFFIRYLNSVLDISQQQAAYYLSFALVLFMTGRFTGTVLMKYITPIKLLLVFALVNIVLLLPVIAGGNLALYAIIGVPFFMSIMFPTIFSLSIQDTGNFTKQASSLIIMSIVGGAIIPLIMGAISDTWSIRWGYVAPLFCFLFVAWFAYYFSRIKPHNN